MERTKEVLRMISVTVRGWVEEGGGPVYRETVVRRLVRRGTRQDSESEGGQWSSVQQADS